jgi:serine/threonine-protein kinase
VYSPLGWYFVAYPEGYALRNYFTHGCLDSNQARNVYMRPCVAGNRNQVWFPWTNTNPITITHWKDVQTGYCLDSNYNGTVYTNPCQWSNRYQQWALG